MNPTGPPFPPIFDGHNDAVLTLAKTGRSFLERGGTPYLDLPRAREAGLGGGIFAVFVRDPVVAGRESGAGSRREKDAPAVQSARSLPMPLEYAQSNVIGLLGRLHMMANASGGQVEIVHSVAQIKNCIEHHVFAVLLHLEGAEPLDPDGRALAVFHAAGVRSVGLTHSRPNRFAYGVPPIFPGSPAAGPGLTAAGRELVRQLNGRKMLVDLSHLNEQGFWDVAGVSEAPLVATHSNAHALSPSPRNLTDRQLDAIRDSGGVVGLNFHVGFVRPDGAGDSNTPISCLVDHLDYMVTRMGIDHVALGSDFADAAVMPKDIQNVTGLPKLAGEISERGYTGESLYKLLCGNWFRVLRATFGR
jgi:membrane dipeptidase